MTKPKRLPPDKYAHERGIPAVPECRRSDLALRFDGHMLSLRTASKVLSWPAVSGRAKVRGEFDYSWDHQELQGVGPIPAGRYWIDPAELWERNYLDPFQYVRALPTAWGNERINIHVMPGTATFGRGGFFIHGGTSPGSAGCIDLTQSMPLFVRHLRAEIGTNTNCFIELMVWY